MSYKHGVYVSEIPTAIVPPVRSDAALPVVIGSAPVNLSLDGKGKVNEPVLCYSYQEAVQALGYSANWKDYTLCEFIYSQFALYAVGPVVLINVLDPVTHKSSVPTESVTLNADGEAILKNKGVLLSSVVIKTDATTNKLNTDYVLSFNNEEECVISSIPTGTITEGATLTVEYDYLDPSAVAATDIVGGVDIATGKKKGLELINEIFPRFRLIPGQIVAPGWSDDPVVAAVMTAKASNINEHFKAIAITDIPTDEVTLYTDVAAWKNTNNYMDKLQVVCWPKLKLGDKTFHMSTHVAGVICKTDADNEDIPYMSPSNKSFQANSVVLDSGEEVWLGPDQAAYLNGQGVVTGLNFIGGWKCWGNRTGVYPSVTDPKDAFIPLRRMFNWIGNTLVQTFWQKVDYPINKRLIETIVDSANIWLNGLSARQFILGGRVEFLQEENPTTDLMDGIVKFHVYITPPTPAREIDFLLEYDPAYLQTLFA